MISRFLTSFDLSIQTMSILCFFLILREKEHVVREEFERSKPLNIVTFMKDRHVESIFDNEDICKRLYPLVPECLRTPSGLKRIVRLGDNVKNSFVLHHFARMYHSSRIWRTILESNRLQ